MHITKDKYKRTQIINLLLRKIFIFIFLTFTTALKATYYNVTIMHFTPIFTIMFVLNRKYDFQT